MPPKAAEPIVADIDQIERLGVRCITGDFLRAEDVCATIMSELPTSCWTWA